MSPTAGSKTNSRSSSPSTTRLPNIVTNGSLGRQRRKSGIPVRSQGASREASRESSPNRYGELQHPHFLDCSVFTAEVARLCLMSTSKRSRIRQDGSFGNVSLSGLYLTRIQNCQDRSRFLENHRTSQHLKKTKKQCQKSRIPQDVDSKDSICADFRFRTIGTIIRSVAKMILHPSIHFDVNPPLFVDVLPHDGHCL